MALIRIGTSGWIYKDWHTAFYPSGTKTKDLLRYLSTQFSTVELNASFYRLPTERAIANWRDTVPEHFVFAVKGSRLITHFLKLRDAEAALAVFADRVAPLGKKLGPVLWQLPPQLKKDACRLADFLDVLPEEWLHAVEFRDRSWYDDEITEMLHRAKVSRAWVSSLALPADTTMTGRFVYLRFHGLQQGYRHNYTREELEHWAAALVRAARKGQSAFVYFNNDGDARAPENARLLRQMVGGFGH